MGTPFALAQVGVTHTHSSLYFAVFSLGVYMSLIIVPRYFSLLGSAKDGQGLESWCLSLPSLSLFCQPPNHWAVGVAVPLGWGSFPF